MDVLESFFISFLSRSSPQNFTFEIKSYVSVKVSVEPNKFLLCFLIKNNLSARTQRSEFLCLNKSTKFAFVLKEKSSRELREKYFVFGETKRFW